eukprot:TRINITY_DN12055_c0_g1_i4.p1 TRINITY_DN12055_c0_g1~~TRINITY_DN12055_c0_g1_i4.p1  ORF type:complete len:311 (-),score=74.45 TRINITY_DN12055_c0_g1_i4:321-1253(-)
MLIFFVFFFFFQAEDGIRDAQESRGLGDVYKRQVSTQSTGKVHRNLMGSGASSAARGPNGAAMRASPACNRALESPSENPKSPTLQRKGAAWSRKYDDSDEPHGDSDDATSLPTEAGSWAVTMTVTQKASAMQTYDTITLGGDLSCEHAVDHLVEIGITDAKELVEHILLSSGGRGNITAKQWNSIFEEVAGSEPDMLEALLLSSSQAVAMELYKQEAIRVFRSMDREGTDSIPFETSQRQLVQMGAPDVFVAMYQTMTDMYLDEIGRGAEDGVCMEQWLAVLGDVAYNPGALDWLHLRQGAPAPEYQDP